MAKISRTILKMMRAIARKQNEIMRRIEALEKEAWK